MILSDVGHSPLDVSAVVSLSFVVFSLLNGSLKGRKVSVGSVFLYCLQVHMSLVFPILVFFHSISTFVK